MVYTFPWMCSSIPLPPSLPSSLPLSLPPSVPPSLSPSLPHLLPPSSPPSLLSSLPPSSLQFFVRYIDFGNAEERRFEYLKPLKSEFRQLPPQALLCSIASPEHQQFSQPVGDGQGGVGLANREGRGWPTGRGRVAWFHLCTVISRREASSMMWCQQRRPLWLKW